MLLELLSHTAHNGSLIWQPITRNYAQLFIASQYYQKYFFRFIFLKNFCLMFAFFIICDKIMPFYFLFSPLLLFVLNQVELSLYEMEFSESCFLLLNVAKMKNIQVFLEI